MYGTYNCAVLINTRHKMANLHQQLAVWEPFRGFSEFYLDVSHTPIVSLLTYVCSSTSIQLRPAIAMPDSAHRILCAHMHSYTVMHSTTCAAAGFYLTRIVRALHALTRVRA